MGMRGEVGFGGAGSVGKIKKALRETPKPLKSPKTAKSAGFRGQGYQRLSRTQADETASFRLARFRFVLLHFWLRAKSGRAGLAGRKT